MICPFQENLAVFSCVIVVLCVKIVFFYLPFLLMVNFRAGKKEQGNGLSCSRVGLLLGAYEFDWLSLPCC